LLQAGRNMDKAHCVAQLHKDESGVRGGAKSESVGYFCGGSRERQPPCAEEVDVEMEVQKGTLPPPCSTTIGAAASPAVGTPPKAANEPWPPITTGEDPPGFVEDPCCYKGFYVTAAGGRSSYPRLAPFHPHPQATRNACT
jgi:hypothetical protein